MIAHTTHRPRLHWRILGIYAAIAYTFASIYDRTDGRIYATPTLADLVNFTGRKPMQLRVLAPAIDRFFVYFFGVSPESANKVVMTIAVFFILFFFRRLLARVVPKRSSTWLAVIVLYPMVWNYCLLVYGDFPSDLPAIAFFLAVLDLLLDRRWLLAYTTFAVGCLNRETIIFAPLAFLLLEWMRDKWKLLPHLAALGVLWLAAKLVLQYVFRDAPGGPTEWQLPYNITFLRDALHGDKSLLRLAVYSFGGLHLLGLFVIWRMPAFIKRLALLVPVILVVMFVYGLYNEVRIFNEAVPVLALVAAYWLSNAMRRDDASERGVTSV